MASLLGQSLIKLMIEVGPDTSVWLEAGDGRRVPVVGSCSIGRSRSNHLVLSDTRVSRRHTLIHLQGEGEYWIVDFGSINGTRVNGKRLTHPAALQHGDVIEIAEHRIKFHQKNSPAASESSMDLTAATARELRHVNAWLLVADIIGSTCLTHSMEAEQLAVSLGKWFSFCNEHIEAQRGSINQYLGDGFFALWIEPPDFAVHVKTVIERFAAAQKDAALAFRFVVHYAQVCSAGVQRTGEQAVVGNQVHFVFRTEKLAGSLKESVVLSEAAAARLGLKDASRCIGHHPLQGFPGEFEFFRL